MRQGKKKGRPPQTAPNKPSDNQDNAQTTALSIKISKRIDSYRAGIPPKYLKMYDRVMAGEGSPRQAIKLQCLACWGWSRSDAAECGGYDCTLYPYNPFQKPVMSPTEPDKACSTNELDMRGELGSMNDNTSDQGQTAPAKQEGM